MCIQDENYLQQRVTLFNTIGRIDPNILDLNDAKLTEMLLFGKTFFNKMNVTNIVDATIKNLALLMFSRCQYLAYYGKGTLMQI